MQIFSFHCFRKDANPEWLKDHTFVPAAGSGKCIERQNNPKLFRVYAGIRPMVFPVEVVEVVEVVVVVVVVVLLRLFLLSFLLLLLLVPIIRSAWWKPSLGGHLRLAPPHIHR